MHRHHWQYHFYAIELYDAVALSSWRQMSERMDAMCERSRIVCNYAKCCKSAVIHVTQTNVTQATAGTVQASTVAT
jgi:hypothetical protein